MNVHLTVDVELWPDRWDLDPARFTEYYKRYIDGFTPDGNYGLPFQLHLLAQHNLKAVFFVETLFSYEFGLEPLRDIVAMIKESGQDVQLHLHPEWAVRMTRPLLPGRTGLNLRDYSLLEQATLIHLGLSRLYEAGAQRVNAFRAGNFGANRETFEALAHAGIAIDSSYNSACHLGPCIGDSINYPRRVGRIFEFPITVFRDGRRQLRHAQVSACSFKELEYVLLQAHERGWSSVMLFWHSAELLNAWRTKRDRIAVRRFERLCEFFGRRGDEIRTSTLNEYIPRASEEDLAKPLSVPRRLTYARLVEQMTRNIAVR
jgi:hypothetical protein